MSYVAGSVTPAAFSPRSPLSSTMTLAMCLAFLRYLGRQFYQPGAGALCRTVAPGAGAGAGVGKVAIGGVIPQQINVDISLAKMAARGITLNQLAAITARLNVVSSAGEIRVGSESIRLHPTGEFQSIDELGDLLVSPHGASATTRLRDIATLSRGLTDSPASIYHANGRRAVTMGVSLSTASTLLTSATLSRPASSRWPPTNRRASTSLFLRSGS